VNKSCVVITFAAPCGELINDDHHAYRNSIDYDAAASDIVSLMKTRGGELIQ